MAQPSQQYPPWLTPVPETIFDQNGVPITTSTTIMYLPLTYYGPSIPLGPEWTYGGITPPPSTATFTTTTTVTSLPTSTATPPFTSTSSSPLPFVPTSSSLPTSPPTATPSGEHSSLTRNQLVGIIVGAVIGSLVLLLAFFVCFLLVKHRRREQRVRFPVEPLEIDQDYVVVDENDIHVPGDGSPRQSGEERDSLLQAHGPGPRTRQRGMTVRGVPALRPGELGAGASQFPAPVPSTFSSNNSGNSGSSTEMSSLGSIVPNSRFTALSPLVEEQREMQRAAVASRMRGPILSSEEQRRVEQEARSELAPVKEEARPESQLLPLPPPPRSVDPEGSAQRLGQKDSNTPQIRTAFVPLIQRSVKRDDSSSRSSVRYDPEEAALVTARRVKPVERGVPASYYYSPLSQQQSSSSSGGILSSISNRLSWFKNLDALPLPGSSRRRSATPKSAKLSDKDPEADVALLSPTSDSSDPQSPIWTYRDTPSPSQSIPTMGASPSHLRPNVRVGLNAEGMRPMSGVSGRSGASSGAATTYFDAYSTFPDTPVLTPLPRAMTPVHSSLASQPSKESNWRLSSALGAATSSTSLPRDIQRSQRALAEFGGKSSETPPAYDENDTIAREHSKDLARHEGSADVLDLPAPSALTTLRNSPPVPVRPAPIVTVASTSTMFSNSNTISSATAPTFFTQMTEETLSPASSEASLKDSSNNPVGGGGPKPDSFGGGAGTGGATGVHMVHVPQTGAPVIGKIYAAQRAKNSNDHDMSTFLHSSSRETNMTGTTLAGEGKTSSALDPADMLEDEPPAPGEGWRSLASVVVGGNPAIAALNRIERRFTLGLQMQPQDDMTQAELGALQAMRSHLSPVSSGRSTGSTPASRRDNSGSTGSRSSRPSAQHSVSHSGSISSSEGRRRYQTSSRYSVYMGKEGSNSNSSRSGGVSPALSAFGNRVRKQGSDEMRRNLTPLSEQSGLPYHNALSSMSSRNTNTTQETFRSAVSAQSTGAPPALMEIEEDVVEAAMRAVSSSNGDRELGLLSPTSQASGLSGSFSVSSVPWASGLDQSWTPL